MNAMHFTQLKNMALSPAHVRACIDSPKKPTPPMRFGSLVHHVYAGEPVLIFPGRRSGKVWDAFEEAHAGEEIFTADEHERAKRCAESISRTPHAVEVLRGEMERTIEWEYLGRKCSSRLDVLGADFVTDLKTTSCAEPGRFWRAARGRFAYHAQLAFYSMAATHLRRAIMGALAVPREHYIVAVESAAPFAVTVLRLKPGAINEGERLCRLWMERLLVCEASNDWPGYTQCVLDVDADEDSELTIDGESFDEAA